MYRTPKCFLGNAIRGSSARTPSRLALLLSLALFGTTLSIAQSVDDVPGLSGRQSPLELQALQSREFDVNKARAVAAVITVLQDQGYALGQTDLDTGVVVGNKPSEKIRVTSRELGEKAPLSGIPNTGEGPSLKCLVERKLSATVSVVDRQKDRSRIRMSFLVDDKPDCGALFRFALKPTAAYIDTDPQRYVEFFARVQQALFIESNVQ
jgi:hypothetical protein